MRRGDTRRDAAHRLVHQTWLEVTEPAAGIVDAVDRRSARLLASLLLVMIVAGLLSATAQLLIEPDFTSEFLILLGGLLGLGVAYILCRTVHYRLAGAAASLVPIAAGGAVGLAFPEDPVWFAFMTTGAVMASAFLTARLVTLVAGATVAATALVLFAVAPVMSSGHRIAVFSFSVIVSTLVALVAQHRAAVERARQEEIREGQALYRQLFEHAPVGIGVATLDGRFVAFNDELPRLGGYSRTDLDQVANVADLYCDDDARAAVLAQLTRDGRVTASEIRMRAKDGTPLDASVSLVPIMFHGQRCTLAILEDISERKRAESERGDLADVIEKSLNEVYVFDTETWHFQYANEGARRNVGYSMEELRTLTPVDLKPEFDAARFGALVEPLLRGDVPLLVFEAVHRRADGTTYLVEVRLQLARRSGRRVYLAIVLDITARKNSEKDRERLTLQLVAQEQRFRALIEHSSDLIALVGPDGTLRHVNPAFASTLGYPVAAWIGKSVLSLVCTEDLVLAERLFAASIAGPGEVIPWQLRLRHADGSLRWLEGTGANHLADPATDGIVINCRDVTERRRVEDAIRQNELRLRVAIDVTDLAVFEMDTSLRYTWMYSPQLGYAPGEVVGRTDHELLGEDGRGVMAVKRRALDSGQREHQEVRVSLDGRESWCALTVEPVRSDSGAIVGLRGASLDVTQARLLHAQFLQSQKMETVGRLAGGIAHDFNNLLTVINGTAALAAAQLAEHEPLHRDLDGILRAGGRAAALTRQLLAFSRKQILQPVVVNLGAVVANVATMLRRLIGEHIALTIVVAEELGTVKADPGQIEQVIVNLAVNARDAMPSGGSLTIALANVEVDVALAHRLSVPPGPYVAMTVSDTGTGLDPAVRERIFEPFFTTKAAGAGTGLGLATVYGIITQSGGGLTVSSEAGRGCAFEIYLPRLAAAALVERAAPHTTIDHGTETVVVVEDEVEIRELVERLLVSAGYTVLSAGNGFEALEVVDRHEGPIDLMVTDVVMPGMGGPELAGRLATSRPQLKVLYMSGFPDDAIQALDEHTHFIAKPFSMTALARRVRDVLDSTAPL